MKALPRRIGKMNNASTADFVEPMVKKNHSQTSQDKQPTRAKRRKKMY